MPKKTIEDIYNIQDKYENEISDKTKIYVHMGTCGRAAGATEVLNELKKLIKEHKDTNIKIIKTGCMGICSREPLITVQSQGYEPVIYEKVDADMTDEIYDSHVVGGKPVIKYAFARGMEYQIKDRKAGNGIIEGQKAFTAEIPAIEDIPYFALQEQRTMQNRGLIDPNSIDDYIGRGGYRGLINALTKLESEEVVQIVIDSGLKGRGGAGFPTGLKWKFAAVEKNDTKFVLCNADEGDPGAYMDRNVLESDPFSVVEGLTIAARAIGAHQGYIYCRAEYPLAVETINKAIKRAESYGLLGENILGTGFNFELEVYEGAGAFVCGEETALMRSIEGKRGNPRPRPPFPAHAGVWEKPTTLNNVETLSNIGQILDKGANWYNSIGEENSKGTKVFSVTGDIKNVGCVEVPIGTKLETIIYDIAGGMEEGKTFKAVQLGGPSGGCLPKQHLDVKVDYETLKQYGTIMGSGGLIVMSEGKSAIDIARFFMEFCKEEACGKCIPGREGTKQMLNILDRICDGTGTPADVKLLDDLAHTVSETALCALCKTSPNPVLSTMRYFKDEYEEAVGGSVEVRA